MTRKALTLATTHKLCPYMGLLSILENWDTRDGLEIQQGLREQVSSKTKSGETRIEEKADVKVNIHTK